MGVSLGIYDLLIRDLIRDFYNKQVHKLILIDTTVRSDRPSRQLLLQPLEIEYLPEIGNLIFSFSKNPNQ
ncbi:hypothetical protein MAH1_08790 [Sessilibacter sp. MAH1]